MSRFLAVLSDIHGNSVALKACLNFLDSFSSQISQPIDIILGGDLFNAGPEPHQVLQMIRPYQKYWVLGNHEVYLREWLENPSHIKYSQGLWHFVPWVGNLLGKNSLKETLGFCQPYQKLWGNVTVVHASLENIAQVPSFFPLQNEENLKGEAYIEFYAERIFIAGHNHCLGFVGEHHGATWLNSGSVGFGFLPQKIKSMEPRATFLLLEEKEKFHYHVRFISIPYSAEDLLYSYKKHNVIEKCGVFALAVLSQSLLNKDITYPIFADARRKKIQEEYKAYFLWEKMKELSIFEKLQERPYGSQIPSTWFYDWKIFEMSFETVEKKSDS